MTSIGQSTTLTGRCITKRMAETVNGILTGKEEHTGDCIIYGDTDSVYSRMARYARRSKSRRAEWGKDIATRLYDNIADKVNEEFPKFMERAFHAPRENGEIIKGGPEIVASKGLYITKKRYAALIYDSKARLDMDGKPWQSKSNGLRSSNAVISPLYAGLPSELLLDVLTGKEKDFVVDKIKEFKYAFKERPVGKKGTPKRVNNLTKFTNEEKRLGKANMPRHVRAAMNWNNCVR